MKNLPPVMLWFREDLRLQDHPALHAAAAGGNPIIAVYILPQVGQSDYPGAARRWWLHGSLLALQKSLEKLGGNLLLIKSQNPESELAGLVEREKICAIHAHRSFHPVGYQRELLLGKILGKLGVPLHLHHGTSLLTPEQALNGAGLPFRVFTPFWRRCSNLILRKALGPPPARLHWWKPQEAGIPLEKMGLLDSVAWYNKLVNTWQPGEQGAQARLKDFQKICANYNLDRDFPGKAGTSKISPHLAHGEVDPIRLLSAEKYGEGGATWVKQIWWREFAHHLLWNFPHTLQEPFHTKFQHFPWQDNVNFLRKWQRGRTGYPLVDAAMRQLWQTAWMHNRARMVVASFLTKDLLLDWRWGFAWFRDTLVDGEDANNVFGWQWSAGCGADGAPFFRIFNPETQSRRLDPQGEYLRQWLDPASLNRMDLHKTLSPIVHHGEMRKVALEAYKMLPK